MKITTAVSICMIGYSQLLAHDLSVPDHDHALTNTPRPATPVKAAPAQVAPFAMFAPAIKTRWDERYLYVEGNGLPAHHMMVGITSWQQQVPLPQNYTGANAWAIPLSPIPAKEPASIRNRFLRGAIAIAANGIPIFNPQNNRGEISFDIGELDQWGGHCGRADDYHYHAAPLHLQTVLGAKLPIAYALDGYPIYGLTETDGSEPKGLDSFNGHTSPELGYHYHASKRYPFVNGGFHGEVTELDGQVAPQPRAQPMRPALQAMRGASITKFTTSATSSERSLTYELASKEGIVQYSEAGNGAWKFVFIDPNGTKREETYRPSENGARNESQRSNSDPQPRGRGERKLRPNNDRTQQNGASNSEMDLLKKNISGFVLSSPDIPDPSHYPIEFTGDGIGISPSLNWKGAPAGTKSFALIMDHLTVDQTIKTSWVMWDIPATATQLPKAAKEIGHMGGSSRGAIGYEPPRSQGPGEKTYNITLYALSSDSIPFTEINVTREKLMIGIAGKVLGSASLPVTYSRAGKAREGNQNTEPIESNHALQGSMESGAKPQTRSTVSGPKDLIKPTMEDTIKINIYADNWFKMYINEQLIAVDSIPFTPHNVVSVDILPEYPMTIAILAMDNADQKTGLEYRTNIGDGGLCVKFSDGTVTSAKWKAKNFFHGPINRNTANPKVTHEPLPAQWWSSNFDDSKWQYAKEYSIEVINPKQPFFTYDFKEAKWIWSDDIALDNTVIFRTKIDKPGWRPRWNTKSDLPMDQTNSN